jgi:hypothetical protein
LGGFFALAISGRCIFQVFHGLPESPERLQSCAQIKKTPSDIIVLPPLTVES